MLQPVCFFCTVMKFLHEYYQNLLKLTVSNTNAMLCSLVIALLAMPTFATDYAHFCHVGHGQMLQ